MSISTNDVQLVLQDQPIAPSKAQLIAKYESLGPHNADGTRALVTVAEGGNVDFLYTAATVLLKQEQPDLMLALDYFTQAAKKGHEEALYLFYKEYLPIRHSREKNHPINADHMIDHSLLLRQYKNPHVQYFVLLLLIYHFPHFLASKEEAQKFVNVFSNHLSEWNQYPELRNAFDDQPPDDIVFYLAEKALFLYIKHQIERIRPMIKSGGSMNSLFADTPDNAIFWVALYEGCHDVVNNIPRKLETIRNDLISTLNDLQPKGLSDLKFLIGSSSLQATFSRLLTFQKEHIGQNLATFQYLIATYLDSTNFPARRCRLSNGASLGSAMCLLDKVQGFQVTAEMEKSCVQNFFDIANVYYNRMMFAEAFVFVHEGCSYLHYVNGSDKAKLEEITLKVYLINGRFDLVRNILCERNCSVSDSKLTKLKSLLKNPYFETIDAFLWFNCERNSTNDLRDYFANIAQDSNPDLLSTSFLVAQKKQTARVALWNQTLSEFSDEIRMQPEKQVVSSSQLVSLANELKKSRCNFLIPLANRLLESVNDVSDAECLKQKYELFLSGNGFFKNAKRVVDNPNIDENLRQEACCSLKSLYLARREPIITVNPVPQSRPVPQPGPNPPPGPAPQPRPVPQPGPIKPEKEVIDLPPKRNCLFRLFCCCC
ncbi:hypothetical protein P9112_005896 [Eukaryota sp. TZLM1-RC]